MKRVSLTTVKDECPYILEWVAYQKLIGFDHILILANDCTDGTHELLEALAANGACETVQFRSEDYDTAPQLAAYALAEKSPLLAEPCLLLVSDIDEFLQINVGDGTLDALLDHAPEFDFMFVRWRVFGSGGQMAYEPGLVTQRFTRCSPTQYRHGKLNWPDQTASDTDGPDIFDRSSSLRWTRTFKTLHHYLPGDRLSVHLPRRGPGPKKRIDGGGRENPDENYSFLRYYGENSFAGSYALCQMNHYCNRSVDEYLFKIIRGDGVNAVDPRGLDHWKTGECNEVEALGMQRWAADLERETRALSDLPGVGGLAEAAADRLKERLEERLTQDPALRSLKDRLCTLAGAEFPASVVVA